MLYRTACEGRGSLRSPPAATAACPAYGGACGGCGPRTPWSWAGAPAPLRGPPGPVAPPPAGLLWCARPWPPSPPLGRCGPCPAALPPARACSRRGPWPLWGRWPRPGPLRSLGVAPGVAAAYRRAACARRGGAAASPGGGRCGGPGPGGRRPRPAARFGPRLRGLGRVALVACRPLTGALRSCRLPACAPSSPLQVPLGRPLSGGPASAMGRRPSSLRGAAGAAAPPLPAAAAPLRGDYQPFGLPSRAAQVALSGHP